MAFRQTQGSFGFGNFRLPDFGISEALFGRGSQISPAGAMNFPRFTAPQARTTGAGVFQGPQQSSNINLNRTSTRTIAAAPTGGGTRTPTPTAPTAPTRQAAPGATGPTQEELQAQALADRQAEVQGIFGPQEDFLSNLLSQAEGGQAGNLAAIEGQFAAQRPGLESARGSLLGQVEQRRGETQRREQTAIGEARRLAQELGQRNLQQFGGGSAGQFAQEFQGRELQRGLGGIRQSTTANLQDLSQQAQDIEANFQNAITQLESQKQSALNDARNRFQDRVSQIQGQQAGLASEKAAAINDATRELRAEQFNIEQSDKDFRQGLIDQFSQAAIQLATNQQQILAEAGTPIDLKALQGVILPTIQGFQQALGDEQIQGQRRPEDELPQGPLTPLAQV